MLTSKDFTYTSALFNLLRNVMNYCYNKKFQLANVTAIYAYVANEFTRQLVEDGMSMELTNMRTARGFSVLYHVFARKQCILCSAVCHKSSLTLPYVISL